MKVSVEVTFCVASFEENPSLVVREVFEQVADKVQRLPGCVCEAPEADDVIRDDHGNIIGSVTVTKEPGDVR